MVQINSCMVKCSSIRDFITSYLPLLLLYLILVFQFLALSGMKYEKAKNNTMAPPPPKGPREDAPWNGNF